MKKAVLGLAAIVLLCGGSASAQTVYYNTAGGRYYHSDPHCDTIDEKYWDDMAKTTTAYTQQLGLRGPCSRCCEEELSAQVSSFPIKNNEKGTTDLRFGGSGVDEISCMAVTPQGHIVMTGYTTSADGTLSDRTKSGWSGWTAMVDIQGNTLWNFCSRYASRDRMRAPVVHEDGTITVLLESRGNEYHQTELIRLDMQGSVISRKPLLHLEKGERILAPEMPGVFAGGYVIASYDTRKRIKYDPVPSSTMKGHYQPLYHWFDFEGNLLGTTQALWNGALMAISDRHTIEAIDQTYCLCAIDEKGNRTKLTSLYEGMRKNKEYKDLVSLDDGGAVAVLYEQNDGRRRSTLCRWDAQGNLVNEIALEGFYANNLVVLGDKMIVCGEENLNKNVLLAVTGTGQIVRRESISSSYTMGRFLIVLDENTVACGQPVSGEEQNGEMHNWDVQIRVVVIN